MNLNYYYNKGYYKWVEKLECTDAGFELFDKKPGGVKAFNQKLTEKMYRKSDETIELCEDGQCFSLTTAYPGLLVGLGALHQTQKNDEELKLGYFFDYTTGMPCIPASGIKGLLRSVFDRYPEYIREYCHSISSVNEKISEANKTWGKVIEELKLDIFSHGSDVFFSAVPHEAKGKHLLGIDYITPHTTSETGMEGLKNPNIIPMLKVMPGVSYVFRFHLQDNMYLDRKNKLELFRQILLDFGVGAKTNVGFGILVETDGEKGKQPYCYLMESEEKEKKNE